MCGPSSRIDAVNKRKDAHFLVRIFLGCNILLFLVLRAGLIAIKQ